jgi:hypothetical protein
MAFPSTTSYNASVSGRQKSRASMYREEREVSRQPGLPCIPDVSELKPDDRWATEYKRLIDDFLASIATKCNLTYGLSADGVPAWSGDDSGKQASVPRGHIARVLPIAFI